MEMTIDRLLAVRYPMAAVRICTTKRAKWTIFVTIFATFALNSHVLFIYKYQYNPGSGKSVGNIQRYSVKSRHAHSLDHDSQHVSHISLLSIGQYLFMPVKP
jgi:hypothetical protein